MFERTLKFLIVAIVLAAPPPFVRPSASAAEELGNIIGVVETKSGKKVYDGDRPVFAYRWKGGGTEWKPYVEELFSPGGVQVLLQFTV